MTTHIVPHLEQAEGHGAHEVELGGRQLGGLDQDAVAEAVHQQTANLGARRDHHVVLRRLPLEPADVNDGLSQVGCRALNIDNCAG